MGSSLYSHLLTACLRSAGMIHHLHPLLDKLVGFKALRSLQSIFLP